MIHNFQTRIVLFFSTLFIGVQVLTLLAVYQVTKHNVVEQLSDNLVYAEQIFDRLLSERGEIIAGETRILAADFGFRAAVSDSNAETVRSAVENLTQRIKGRRGFYIDLDGRVVADTAGRAEGSPFYFQDAIATAEKQGQAVAFGLLDGEFYEFAVVPVLAPIPIGWVAVAVAVDRNLVEQFKQLSSAALEISLVERSAAGSRILTSSLADGLQTDLRGHVSQNRMPETARPVLVELGDNTFISQAKRLPTARADQPIMVYLQVDLAGAFHPYRIMLYAALGLLGLGLAATLFGGVLIARRITQPVRLLADATQRIMAGRFDQPLAVTQQDELGRLAQAFNHMMVGIEQREQRLAQQLRHDSLTGLPNRLFFEERLSEVLQAGIPVAVALVGLDRYTEINNTLGHGLGDRLVMAVGELLRGRMPEDAALARVASDEFALVVPHPGERDALVQLAETLLLAFDAPVAIDQFTVDVSAHIGIACCGESEQSAKALLRNADVAMYVARLHGPRSRVYRREDDPCQPAALSLMGELRAGLESGQFSLYVQPLVDMAQRRVSHVECLIRWKHPERGMIPPDAFIPLAEQTGHIHRVTDWALREAFHIRSQWRRQGLPVKLAVNLSAKDLFSHQLPALLDELLATHEAEAADFVLEVTESSVMQDAEQALKLLEGIRAKGFQLAVDDFGTGYSSMAYLKRLPVSELKIDKSFVMGLAGNQEDAVIVRSIIELGHNLGMTIVAEGLEDEASFAQLDSLGCDLAQGYWISRPMPWPDFAGWLKQSGWGAET